MGNMHSGASQEKVCKHIVWENKGFPLQVLILETYKNVC